MKLPRWLPALVMMSAIFVFSSIPSDEMIDFGWADFLVKKSGHMLGYALLAVSYAWGMRDAPSSRAWIFAVLYAASDEFHQHFVAGRHASPMDILIDAAGAAIGLWVWTRLVRYSNSTSKSSST